MINEPADGPERMGPGSTLRLVPQGSAVDDDPSGQQKSHGRHRSAMRRCAATVLTCRGDISADGEDDPYYARESSAARDVSIFGILPTVAEFRVSSTFDCHDRVGRPR